MRLSELQALMQRAILDGDDAVLSVIPDGAREKKEVLLGVYRHAYVARLVEVTENDYEFLAVYMGTEAFADMARAYIAAYPSDQPNARWFSRHLPEFLRSAEPYASHPQLADLAELEFTLGLAFDAADAPLLRFGDLAGVPPENWGGLVFTAHPSAQRLALGSNAATIWIALKEEKEPPPPERLERPSPLLVWRQETAPQEKMPMWRQLGAEEAMMWDEAAKGVPFAGLCEMLATYDQPEEAPVRAARYLSGWIASGLLSAAAPGAPARRSLAP